MGFSHSLLSPQAWVFLRCELGLDCIRAELAKGEVCLACTGAPTASWEGRGSTKASHPTPTVQVRVISKGNVPKNRGWSGVGSGPSTPQRSQQVDSHQVSLPGNAQLRLTPGCPQSSTGFGLRLITAVTTCPLGDPCTFTATRSMFNCPHFANKETEASVRLKHLSKATWLVRSRA